MAHLIPQHHRRKAFVKKGKKMQLKCLSSIERKCIFVGKFIKSMLKLCK